MKSINIEEIEKLMIFKLKIFSDIKPEIVKDIIFNSEIRKYEKGETIISQGDDSNGEGYIIIEGTASVTIGDKQVATLTKGDIFGEIALLNEEKRNATVRAETELEVIVLTMNKLMEMLADENNNINEGIINRIEENINNNLI